MKRALLAGYAFHAQARRIDFSGLDGFDLRRVLSVINLTARQELYAPGEPGFGGDLAAGGVLSLDCDTRAMDDADALLIVYEDDAPPLPPDAATDSRLERVRLLLAGSTATEDVAGTLAAGAGAVPVATDPARTFLEITNTGGAPLSYRWGAAATASAGHILSTGQSARYDAKVPIAALNLFSADGTSFFVSTG
jgi:hypothetical protein